MNKEDKLFDLLLETGLDEAAVLWENHIRTQFVTSGNGKWAPLKSDTIKKRLSNGFLPSPALTMRGKLNQSFHVEKIIEGARFGLELTWDDVQGYSFSKHADTAPLDLPSIHHNGTSAIPARKLFDSVYLEQLFDTIMQSKVKLFFMGGKYV
jgi:hypothetical protein